MHGFALALLGLALADGPLVLPKDVYEIQTQQFALPLRISSRHQDDIERIRLFVSEDHGKTWTHNKDYKPSDEQVTFTAPHDGEYWFAVQVVFDDGHRQPARLKDLAPGRKVYVNRQRRALKANKSYEELQYEVDQLQETVQRLRTRIKQLESERNHNAAWPDHSIPTAVFGRKSTGIWL